MSMSSGSLLVAEPRSFYIVEPSSPQWIEVLVNSPWGQELCIYSISPDLMVQPGDIVSVPFGKQIMGGIAIRYANSIPEYLNHYQVKAIDDVITSVFFKKNYFKL